MSTTSGASSALRRTASSPSTRHPDELDVLQAGDEPSEAVADDAVVVGEQDADHVAGTSISTVVPSPGLDRTTSVPPRWPTRSSSRVSPTCPSWARSARCAASNPLPSSVTIKRMMRGSSRVTLDAHRGSVGVGGDVAQRLACHAVDERVGGRPGGGAIVDVQLRRDVLRLQRAEQVVQRRLQTRGLQAGRMDLDEQRAQRAHAVAQPARAVAEGGRVGVGAPALRAVGERREAEGDAREVLHDAVVQVGGDAATLVVGRLDGPLEQHLALPVAALQAPGERPRQRDLAEQQDDERRDQRRRERAEQPARRSRSSTRSAGRSRRAPGVPFGRADRGVRLEQLALLALEAVLRLGQVAELRLGAAGREQLALVARRARSAVR